MTRRQKRCFDFIAAEIKRTGGVAPSYDEIADHLGISTRSQAHAIVEALEKQGLVKVQRKVARGISIVPRTPLSCPCCGYQLEAA